MIAHHRHTTTSTSTRTSDAMILTSTHHHTITRRPGHNPTHTEIGMAGTPWAHRHPLLDQRTETGGPTP